MNSSRSSKRCPHYQLYSETLGMDGPPAYLAIRRCLLTERLVNFLSQTEEGKQVADKLVIQAGDRTYAFVGPDLDAVTQRSCHVERCENRCTPAYSVQLEQFNITDPGEEAVTCDEETETNDDSSPSYASL